MIVILTFIVWIPFIIVIEVIDLRHIIPLELSFFEAGYNILAMLCVIAVLSQLYVKPLSTLNQWPLSYRDSFIKLRHSRGYAFLGMLLYLFPAEFILGFLDVSNYLLLAILYFLKAYGLFALLSLYKIQVIDKRAT